MNEIELDDTVLYKLFASIRINEFRRLGLSIQELDTLLLMQYEAQKNAYQRQFPQAKYEIIYYENVCIGRIITELNSRNIHLIDIALLPKYRGKGYGTQLICALQNSAAEKGLSVTLNVLQGNPARRLYERCGFYVIGEVDPYIAMRFESSNE